MWTECHHVPESQDGASFLYILHRIRISSTAGKLCFGVTSPHGTFSSTQRTFKADDRFSGIRACGTRVINVSGYITKLYLQLCCATKDHLFIFEKQTRVDHRTWDWTLVILLMKQKPLDYQSLNTSYSTRNHLQVSKAGSKKSFPANWGICAIYANNAVIKLTCPVLDCNSPNKAN